ncbi:ABC transporter permease [Geminisphaera colitermitum]|uniref:ABC transporter permease subunit n=1 Tax=Geminisphaera colitermitum TaxID=1148786 RepID=UPI000196522C|nr:ABC transporter permease [Geminisphaera colitermitum]
MRDYFLRRFLLIPPTLIGVTLIVFFITRLVPGGPVERALAEARQADVGGTGGGGGGRTAARADAASGTSLSAEQLDQLRKFYGFDKPWYAAYFDWTGKVLRGDLGTSYIYHLPVTTVIASKLPISIYFGLLTTLLTYGVCLPLGIVKAMRHRTLMDNATSVVVFAGYAIPSYVFGSIIMLIFAARLQWLPLGGFVSDDFADFTLWGKFTDLARHTILPLSAYMVGSFAFTTMLMKNHLMDNLAADYMRTAVAKGVPFRTAVFRHALRNSLIPLATTFGQNIGLVLTGSFLIEVVFDIDGMGLLGFKSVVDRDYPVVMGILFISSILLLVGNILSDLLVAVLDPRIRFN